jgi:hypothetical protein
MTWRILYTPIFNFSTYLLIALFFAIYARSLMKNAKEALLFCPSWLETRRDALRLDNSS